MEKFLELSPEVLSSGTSFIGGADGSIFPCQTSEKVGLKFFCDFWFVLAHGLKVGPRIQVRFLVEIIHIYLSVLLYG